MTYTDKQIYQAIAYMAPCLSRSQVTPQRSQLQDTLLYVLILSVIVYIDLYIHTAYRHAQNVSRGSYLLNCSYYKSCLFYHTFVC